MKKNLLVLAVMGIMCFANVTTAHAEFIVQPTAEEQVGIDTGTMAGYKWYIAEEQRQINRLIDNNAPRINQISDPVERLAEVVKAVADYSEVTDNPSDNVILQWKTGCFSNRMMTCYADRLCREVGLNIVDTVVWDLHNYGTSIVTCNINGVIYWADAYTYDRTGDTNLLGTTNQPSYVETREQHIARGKAEFEAVPEELRNLQYDSNGVYIGGMF